MKKLYSKITSYQIIQVLSYPPFFAFSLSVFLSQIAFNMLTISLIFLVFFLTSSNFAVSLLLLSILLPQIFLSFFGGIVADVRNRRNILVLGNLVRALILLMLFFNTKSLLVIYLVAFLVSSVTQFYVPAESPLIPEILPRSKLVAANSVFGIGLFGSILVGYVLAGPIIGIVGRSGVFLILAAFFLLAAIFAYLIQNFKKNHHETKLIVQKSIITELIESLMLLRNSREVGDAFFLLIFSQIIIFLLATLIPGYAKTILDVAAEDLSLIIFAPAAIGMLASSLLIGGAFVKIEKRKLMDIGVLISGAVLVLLPFVSKIFSQGTLHIVLLLAFMAGAANALIFIPSQATIQSAVHESFRSKIYGLLFALIGVFSLLPILLAGGVADLVGVAAVLFAIGGTIVLIGIMRFKKRR